MLYLLLGVLLVSTQSVVHSKNVSLIMDRTMCREPAAMETREYYLRWHNNLREKIRNGKIKHLPTAKSLPNLQWDNELAIEAKINARSCVYGKPPLSHWGKNEDFEYLPFEESLWKWTEEGDTYIYGAYSADQESQHGHFIQMVQSATTHVGCYKNYCESMLINRDYEDFVFYTICYYRPGGKRVGHVPYESV